MVDQYPARGAENAAARKCGRGVRSLVAIGLLAASLLPAQAPTPSFDDLVAQAAAARDQQNIPLAIDLYNRAEQLKPDWPEGWWNLTVLQYSANQYPGAIDAATHLLQLAPHAAPAMALRGLSEFETADYKAALTDLDTAVQHGAASDPRNEQIVRYHLALLLTRAGRFQDALTQYTVFAQKKLSDPEMLVGLGLAGMRIPSFPNEVAAADRPMIQDAGSAGYTLLGGDSPGADEQFEALFAKYPTAPNLHLFYGFLLFSHDPNLAVTQFQAEVEIAPQNVSARALLAYAMVLAGRYKEALPYSQTAAAAAPDMEMAQLALGRSLGEAEDPERGIDILKKVLEQDHDNMEAHIGLAALYARAGKREDAYRERMVCLGLAK